MVLLLPPRRGQASPLPGTVRTVGSRCAPLHATLAAPRPQHLPAPEHPHFRDGSPGNWAELRRWRKRQDSGRPRPARRRRSLFVCVTAGRHRSLCRKRGSSLIHFRPAALGVELVIRVWYCFLSADALRPWTAWDHYFLSFYCVGVLKSWGGYRNYHRVFLRGPEGKAWEFCTYLLGVNFKNNPKARFCSWAPAKLEC
jgi:hypothetical protein